MGSSLAVHSTVVNSNHWKYLPYVEPISTLCYLFNLPCLCPSKSPWAKIIVFLMTVFQKFEPNHHLITFLFLYLPRFSSHGAEMWCHIWIPSFWTQFISPAPSRSVMPRSPPCRQGVTNAQNKILPLRSDSWPWAHSGGHSSWCDTKFCTSDTLSLCSTFYFYTCFPVIPPINRASKNFTPTICQAIAITVVQSWHIFSFCIIIYWGCDFLISNISIMLSKSI